MDEAIAKLLDADPLDVEAAKRIAPELAAIVLGTLLDLSPATVKRKYLKSDTKHISDFWVVLALDCLWAGRRWQEKVTAMGKRD